MKETIAAVEAPPGDPPKPAVDSKDGGVVSKQEPAPEPAKARPEREATAKDYFRVFTYAKKFDIFLFVAAFFAACGSGITMPLMNVVFGRLVGDFSAFASPTGLNPAAFEKQLNTMCLYIFLLFIARFVLGYINKFALRMIGIRMSGAIRLHYLQSLFGQTIHVLDSMPAGAAAGTITGTANTLQLGISEKLGTFVEFSATVIAAIVIAFTFNWKLTLVTMSSIFFLVIVISVILPFIIKFHSKTTKAETKATAVASEAFGSIRMVMACGAEERVNGRYARWSQAARAYAQRAGPLFGAQFGLIFFSLYAAFALAFWFGGKEYYEGHVDSIGTVVIVLMSVMLMAMSMERISSPLIAISKAMVAAAEFFVVIDAPKPPPGTLKEPDVSSKDDIVLTDVDFAYPSRPHVKVLDGLNIRFEAGKVTAIVGPSGSGKSTVVGLIERWYSLKDNQYVIEKTKEKDKMKEAEKKKKEKARKKAEKAGITVEEDSDDASIQIEDTGPPVALKGMVSTSNRDLDEFDIKWWRSQIGLVQQEPFLFNDTIFNNVAYGLIGSEHQDASDERKLELVKEACEEAFATEFIDRLPDGYQTIVGDSGAKLSGGQRQRIAIARSIIKKPKILILDEATSAIDVRGEKIVQAALDKASKNRTTIIIAHRLSTIKTADKICVMRKGRLIEEGTHDGLLANDEGAYYGLVHAQELTLGDDASSDDDIKEEDIGDVLAREKSAAISETEATNQKTAWKNRGLFNSFGKLLFEQRSKMPLFVLTIFGAMLAASAIPLQAYLFAKIIVVFSMTGDAFLRESSFWSLMWFVLAIAIGTGYGIMGWASTHFQHHVQATYREQYLSSLMYQKATFFDDEENSGGALTARVAGDAKQLEELLGINMGMVYTSLFGLIGALCISFAFGWKLALVALCVTMPIGFGAGYFRFKYELAFEKMYAKVFAESSSWASESIGAFRTVTALTLEDVICDRYEKLLNSHTTEAFKSARFRTLVLAISDSVSLGCQALILWYGGRLVASGEMSVLNFFVCYMASILGSESAGQGLSFGPNAAQATSAANRILSIRESSFRDTTKGPEVDNTDGGIKIELEDVHFKYPTRNVSIFRGLDITIEKGQFAALVGASGSGKTSIVSLLERFYEPHRGRILFNGVDIASMNLFEYRKLLSLVAQEATLFQGTLRENILLGVDPSTVTDEQLHAVCRDASIHDFIISLPEGYETDIGSRGVSLSGGQKQRIAIARALIRNPRVLLLDEATSSLDSDTEKLIQATFERVAKGRTTVAVAHRLSTIQKADIIYVLGEGKVLEKGNHAELLKKRGVYWHMCHSQALDR